MAKADTTQLAVETRDAEGSRSNRRLRRTGYVPGVVYGGDGEPLAIQVGARTLRNALAHSGAVIDLTVDGGTSTPVVLKDRQRNPVNGETIHIDLLRVRLDVAISAPVPLVLTGEDESPGVSEGGVVEQLLRELEVEALPTEIPDEIQLSVAGLSIGDNLTIADVTAPDGVTLLDEPETTVVTLSAPRLRLEDEEEGDGEVETETELVGEAGEAAAEGATADEAEGDGE